MKRRGYRIRVIDALSRARIALGPAASIDLDDEVADDAG